MKHPKLILLLVALIVLGLPLVRAIAIQVSHPVMSDQDDESDIPQKLNLTGKLLKIDSTTPCIVVGTSTCSSAGFNIFAGIAVKAQQTNTTTTLLPNDFLVTVTGTIAAARTVILPLASSAALTPITTATSALTQFYIVKDVGGGASVNNITVQATSTNLIDGTSTKVINTNFGVLRLFSNGTNWFTW